MRDVDFRNRAKTIEEVISQIKSLNFYSKNFLENEYYKNFFDSEKYFSDYESDKYHLSRLSLFLYKEEMIIQML